MEFRWATQHFSVLLLLVGILRGLTAQITPTTVVTAGLGTTPPRPGNPALAVLVPARAIAPVVPLVDKNVVPQSGATNLAQILYDKRIVQVTNAGGSATGGLSGLASGVPAVNAVPVSEANG